jgi:hypothetical protein
MPKIRFIGIESQFVQGVQIREAPVVVFTEGVTNVSVHGVDEDFDVFGPGIESFSRGGDNGVRGIWGKEGREGREGKRRE